MGRRSVELLERHLDALVHEYPLPGHLDVVEIHHRVVLVELARQRIVEARHRMLLVGLSRQHPQALGIHRYGERHRLLLVARRQRLDAGDEHLVGHDGRGPQHLGAADGQAGRVLVDDAGGEERVGLGVGRLRAVGLGIDDHVGEEQVVVPGEAVIVAHRRGPLGIMRLEQVEPHVHAADAGRHVVGRAAHEAVMQPGPGLERAAALHQLGIVARQLPASADPQPAVRARKRHGVDVRGFRLEVVEPRRGSHRIAERLMDRHIGDALAVYGDVTPVAKAFDMVLTVACRAHRPSILGRPRPAMRRQP